jgi:hypothetical protein
MAASRINKLLYASTSRTFADTAAATYMNLENDRLKEERGLLDGVDKSEFKRRSLRCSLHVGVLLAG